MTDRILVRGDVASRALRTPINVSRFVRERLNVGT